MARIMPKKSGFPLNNPLPEKSVPDDAGISFKLITSDGDGKKKEIGVSKGGRGKGKVAEAIVRCQMCGRQQKIVWNPKFVPEWHRCIWCHELQPMDGYHVVVYGLGLPRVLAPHELKARNSELGY